MSCITRNIAATTACISATGTGCAGPIAGSAHSRRHAFLLGLAALGSIAASPPSTAELDVSISGLRNRQGAVMLCLTRRGPDRYLQCAQDPQRVTRVVPSRAAGSIRLDDLPAGDYALLVIHDENRNGKLDKMLGMPREGFGFSRNPAIRMGPPSYNDVHFSLSGRARQTIKLKYLL